MRLLEESITPPTAIEEDPALEIQLLRRSDSFAVTAFWAQFNGEVLSCEKVQAFQEGRLAFSPEDLAAYWNVKVERIYELVKDKRLKGTKIGRLLRFDWQDIEEYRKRNRTMREW